MGHTPIHAVDESVLSQACHGFGLGEPSHARSLPGTRNLNFEVRTPLGRWVLRRRHPGYCEPERIAFDHAALRFLSERGVPVAAPQETGEVQTILRMDDDLWEAFPFFHGTPLSERDRDQIWELGTETAHFHRIGQSFPRRYSKLADRAETDPELLLGLIDQLNCPSAEAHRPWIMNASRSLPDDLFFSLPHTLIHGDLQPANLLFLGQELTAFLDLDWCGWMPRIYDLAYAFLFCCSHHEKPIDGGDIRSVTQPPDFDQDAVESFLHPYQTQGGHLKDIEREALPAQVALTWCHCRLAGAFKVPEEEREAFLARPPGTIEDLLQSMRIPA